MNFNQNCDSAEENPPLNREQVVQRLAENPSVITELQRRLSSETVEDFEDPPLPSIRTERFLIHQVEVMRDGAVGCFPRTMFTAWHHSVDIPRPLCMVIVNQCFANYVEWIHVDESHRRQGIATEVLRAVELELGGLTLDGVTDSGEAFCDAYEAKFSSPVE